MPSTMPQFSQTAVAPELASVAAFAEYLAEDERTSFGYDEVADLSRATRTSISKLLDALAERGFSYEGRSHTPAIRGFRTPSSRWIDCPTYGTTGGDQIGGFAGPQGSKLPRSPAKSGRQTWLGVAPR